MNTFFEEVYVLVSRIPWGKVASYGQLARLLGAPRSARIVGWAMHRCPADLPWHRVIRSDGSLPVQPAAPADPGAGAALQGITSDWRQRLEEEGIPFLADGRVDMEACRWEPD